jgi:hypothetical protein
MEEVKRRKEELEKQSPVTLTVVKQENKPEAKTETVPTVKQELPEVKDEKPEQESEQESGEDDSGEPDGITTQ